ncbi:uncharacterized protein [Branchiostoma lanceolatum]|uniref:uncharacterized protein isoform X2 n=1 Tax=Branchiostoma lanceolatum TaxID=7740 RepID=UPI003456DED9
MTYNVRTEYWKCSRRFGGHFRLSIVAVLTVLACFVQEVSGSPSFTQMPGNLSFIKGEDVVFNWAFTSENPTLEIDLMTWFKVHNGQFLQIMKLTERLLVREPYEGRVERVGQAGFRLFNIGESDAGIYEVSVLFSDRTEIVDRANLDVKYAPMDTAIIVPPSLQLDDGRAVAKQGDDLALLCTTRSNPASRFSWTNGQSHLPTTSEVDQTTGVLTIRRVQKRDTGTYRCHASNTIEPDGDNRISIIVHYPPTRTTARIVSPQANITVGDDVTIRCSCEDAMPAPKFRWAKNGLRARDTSDLPNSATVDENLGLLTIRNVQLRDSGSYSCVADNGVPPTQSVEVAVNVAEPFRTTAKPTIRPTSNDIRSERASQTVIIATACTVPAFCLIVLVVSRAFCWRRRRSNNGCKPDNVSSSSNALIHRERLEYLCPDMNVLRVSNATELDKMADPVLQEFWDCLVRMDVDPVLVFLREKRSLSVDETAGVRAAPCVVERLLEILCVLKGDQASSVLSDALRHSDQTHLADLLDGKVLPDAKCVTIATTTETSFGITFRPAYKNPQHFGDVDKYLVTLELTTPEPKIIVKRRISASDPLQAEFSGLEQGTSYNVTVISKRGDVKSAGITVTITTIGGYEEPSRLLQRFNVEEQSKIHHVLIYKDKITLLEPLGNGNFGEVRHGVYRKGKKWVECAAKTLYDTAAPNEMVSLLQEGLRMIKFNHDNVLELTGICVHGNQAMIVLPYMKHGDLRKYLIKKQTLPLLENLRLCLDIARGMAYLSDNDIVHRDLAARNCMLDENLRVKVADFGLCRDVHEKGYYRIQSWETGQHPCPPPQVKLPYKWMAPESHATYIFDTKTDIWSYGIVLWEIFAAGQTPYPGIPGVSIVHQLREGYRMERPNRCPIMLYNSVMKQCWLTNPLERPNFKDVLRKVEQIHTSFKHRSDFENTDVQVHSLA